jgi:beta-lactamase class A
VLLGGSIGASTLGAQTADSSAATVDSAPGVVDSGLPPAAGLQALFADSSAGGDLGAETFGPPEAPHSLVLPAVDVRLQRDLERVMERGRFASLVRDGKLSVVLIDLTDPAQLRLAEILPDSMRYAASLPKIGVMLTVFEEVEAGRLTYTPELRSKLERMIRRSENAVASELIQLVGFDAIEATLRDPRYELYDPKREGGIWVGRGYGSGVGTWKRDPIHAVSHGATARQVARFLLLIERGELVSPAASAEMKRIMGNPEIRHKFVKGLLDIRPMSKIFRKSGTYKDYHADAAIVERAGHRYIAVALLEAPERGSMARLIQELDAIVMR